MQKLHFSIVIDAPREKVWDTMLKDATYRQWTAVFGPGSHYVGDWSEGSKILFLAPGEKSEMGMVSRIAESHKPGRISIEHLGVVQDGREDTSSDAVKKWAGAHEDYTLIEKNGMTELLIDTDTDEEFKSMFEEAWPKALQELKKLAEAK